MKLSSIKHSPFVVVAIAIFFGAVGFTVIWQLSSNRRAQQTRSRSCSVAMCVSLKPNEADPDTITVKVGDVVQFNSADGKAHSLSTGLGGAAHEHTGPYSSGEFKADEAWRVKFKEAGTFKFHDHNNPKINILVVAYQQGGDHTIKP